MQGRGGGAVLGWVSLPMQILSFLKEVPDVVWSGLLASGLTLLGVMLSNWSNTRRLLKQLSHDSNEKERDRINALRKDVYLKVAEEAARISSYLGKIPQMDPSKETIGDGLSDFLGVAAKLQLVSQPETSKLVGQLVTRYGEMFMGLLTKASPVHDLNTDIRIASDYYERNQAEVNRILAEMRQMQESGDSNPARFAALKHSFESAQEAAKHFSDERSCAYEKQGAALREYMICLLSETRSIAPLQMQLNAAIRSELNLATDMVAYEAQLQENFDRMDKAIKGLLDHLDQD